MKQILRNFNFICFFLFCLPVVAQKPKLVLPIGHTGIVISAVFSPDGNKVVTASSDKTAIIWDTKTGQLLHILDKHTKDVVSAKFSTDGKRVVTASWDKTAKIWDVQTGEMLFNLDTVQGHNQNVLSAEFSQDGKYVVTCSEDKTAIIWNATTGKFMNRLTAHKDYVNSVCFSYNGKMIVTSSNDYTAIVWNVETGDSLYSLKGHTGNVTSAIFSPDSLSNSIVTSSFDKTARVWDSKTGLPLFTLLHADRVMSANFSKDGNLIVTASRDRLARIWNTETGKLQSQPLIGHTKAVRTASFSTDGNFIVTGSEDNTAIIWNAKNGQTIDTLRGHTGYVYAANFSKDGNLIVTASRDFTGRIWKTKTGLLLKSLVGHTASVRSANFSPHGSWVVTTSNDNIARIWDVKTGALLKILEGHRDFLTSASFSPDSSKIITGSVDSTAILWDVETGRKVHVLKKHTDFVTSVAFSADGKYVITGSSDRTAIVWDVETGDSLFTLRGHTSNVSSVNFSNNNKFIVTGSWDRTARIWDAKTGKQLDSLKGSDGHINTIACASFSPNDSLIVTASWDSKVKLWEVKTGKFLQNLGGSNRHTNRVMVALFSPDGTEVVTGSFDNTIKFWDLKTGKFLKGRNLGNNTVLKDFNFYNNTIVATNNSETEFFNTNSNKHLYSFYAIDKTDYLITDSSGHYDGTEHARRMLYYTCNSEVIQLEQVKTELWVPNLAYRIMKKEIINAPTLSGLNICNSIPQVETKEINSGVYQYIITPQAGGVGDIAISVNGIEFKRINSRDTATNGKGFVQLKTENKDIIVTIPIDSLKPFFVAGKDNIVSIKALIKNNTISSRGNPPAEEPEVVSTVPTNVYAVFVGVSEYNDPKIHLQFASKDAQDLTNTFGFSARKMFGKEHVFQYMVTTDTTVAHPDTANGVYYMGIPNRETIKKTFETIGKKTGPNDILVIFFAGHGEMREQNKQFYFITAEATQSLWNDSIEKVSMSTKELTEWIRPEINKASRRILIFDACNSGGAISSIKKTMEEVRDNFGVFILSASSSTQSAYEIADYSQGLLTYSLLKTIKQSPNILDSSKYLDVSKWFNTSAKEVVAILKQRNPEVSQVPIISGVSTYNIGFVDDTLRNRISLPMLLPVFGKSEYTKENLKTDSLQFRKLIDKELGFISGSGKEATLVFDKNSDSDDTYKLTGTYVINGSEIIVKIQLIKGEVLPLYNFEAKGTVEQVKDLCKEIVSKTIIWITENVKAN